MTLRLYDTQATGLLIEKAYPDTGAGKDSRIQECTTTLAHALGRGYYHEIYFDDIHIGYGNAVFPDKFLLHFESDLETVEMHFALKGKNTAVCAGFPQQVQFEANQHNIIYANRIQGNMTWHRGDFQLFEINLSPRFFKRFLQSDTDLFLRFRKAIEDQRSTLMQPAHYPISLHMHQLLQDMMQCNRTGVFKRMFLEAKVIELLLLQLEQLTAQTPLALPRKYMEKMYAVRDFIVSNPDQACSLIDLAHRVGTNEFTLKKGFKALFGTTVFGFWNDLKMEQARKMLLEQQMNINEVSDRIGYKNARHFSAAFKRKYGILPSQLKG